MLADALPDRFGNRLIDAWLAETGPEPGDVQFGGPALLHRPPQHRRPRVRAVASQTDAKELEVARLVELANRVLDERANLAGALGGDDDADALEDILSVGTSAGGARAKAVLAWNPKTGEFRSGQLDVDTGFEHWLLKFDGISNVTDTELADSGFGRIEYAYAGMARAAGITMSDCRSTTKAAAVTS